VQDFKSSGLLDVERQTAFVVVQPYVAGGKSAHRAIPMADQVAVFGFLDLDNFGAHVAQNARAMGT
jgi:hypothetical protein